MRKTNELTTEQAIARHAAILDCLPGQHESLVAPQELVRILASARTRTAEIDADLVASRELETQLARIRTETNLALRTARPAPRNPRGNVMDFGSANTVEAALCLNSGLVEPENHFSEQTLEHAGDRRYKHFGLQSLIIEAACANGYQYIRGERITRRSLPELLQYALPSPPIQAAGGGFSSLDVSGIVSGAANKFLLSGFDVVPQTWREVAAVTPVSDLKQATRYRMTAGLEYEELPPTGLIEHGTIGEDSYTVQARTYAKMLTLTRTDIINDDLGVFDAIKRSLGMGAALKMDKVFWTFWMNNAAFFTVARGNRQTGAATALGEAGLNTASQLFNDMVGPDGNFLGIRPDRIVVPTALEATAKIWHTSTEIRDTTASTKYALDNPHHAQYRPVCVPQLSSSAYPGYSATAWYLLCNPAILATADMCFLNGQESPTIESASADFNTLGIQLRGYHDFGVNFSEYQAGVASDGA